MRYEHMQARRHLGLLTLWLPMPGAHALPSDLRRLAEQSMQGPHAPLQLRLDPP
jgi:hypothetical protein